jgi:eukaryotic-like serine/threonine-protein kinase
VSPLNARRPGDHVGPWRVVAELGRGGWGTVYSVEHSQSGRWAAVKILSPEVCEHPAAIKRFRREARATSTIGHANVVEVIETGQLPDGSAYYAMELLVGESLAQTLKREGRLPWSRVRHIVLQLCGALAAAHDKGVVHRDIKPENCFRITRGDDVDFIKLLDFGVAKFRAEIGERTLTATGDLLGTTAFMAPEQIRGERIDHRTDIHALGVLLYVLLTGTLPFSGFMAIVENAATPMQILVAGLTDAIDQLVARALRKDPKERFQSAVELGEAVAAITASAVTTAAPVAATDLSMAPTEVADEPRIDVLAATEGALEELQTVPYRPPVKRR